MQIEQLPNGGKEHLRLSLRGELDALTAPKLYEEISRLVQERPGLQKITLHCRDLVYLSSAGAGILLMCMDNFAPKGITLELAEVQPEVYNILDLLGLTKLLPVNHA
jgi:anti-anti-sigma factor